MEMPHPTAVIIALISTVAISAESNPVCSYIYIHACMYVCMCMYATCIGAHALLGVCGSWSVLGGWRGMHHVF